MESANNTTEAMAVRQLLRPNTLTAEVLLITRLIFGVFVVIINGAIVLAYLIQKIRRPSSVQLSPAGLLVINLLVADVFVGGVSVVNIATFTTTMVQWRYWCCVRLSVSFLAMVGSHVALINVAVDRYVAIMHTLQYRDWMTMRRSVTMVLIGWFIPFVGAVGYVIGDNWRPGLVRCSDIPSFKVFLRYVWIPAHVAALLCVILIQCRVYFELRRYDAENAASNQILRRFSQKSARVLFWVTTTFVVCWGPFDVCLILIVAYINPLIKTMYDAFLILAQMSFLVNPLIYSYQTVNIRRPVTDLCKDLKKWLQPPIVASQASTNAQSVDVNAIRTISSFQKTGSSSSVLTQFTSGDNS